MVSGNLSKSIEADPIDLGYDGQSNPDDPNKNAVHLNYALESVSVLYAMLSTISTQLKAAYPLIELGKALPVYPHD